MNTQPLPQLTLKAVLLGVFLSMTLAAANAYLGLFAGMTISASIPAAVVSMGLLRLFRNSNILENNIVQTAASAGESLAAGVIFTLPALILLEYWQVFDYWWVSALAGVGGLLGVLFTVPLRRSLIVEQQLPFPEGTATAEVLRTGDDPSRGLRVLLVGGLVGGVYKLLVSGLKLLPGSAQTATFTGGGTVLYAGMNLSPALVSVGYIVGLNIAVLVLLGGVLAWGIAIPVYSSFFMPPPAADTDAVDLAFSIWSGQIRYLGVGAMLTGGIWAITSISGSVVQAIRDSIAPAGVTTDTEKDMPINYVFAGVIVLLVPTLFIYHRVTGELPVSLALTTIMALAGFLFAAVAGYMAGLLGSSNNPVSGMTIATILFASLLLLWMTGAGNNSAAAAILIGAVVCCAAAIAGDNMQDLKAGWLLGATPWKQQVMQGVGVISAVLVMAPVLNLLLTAYGIGPATPERPDSLTAPQATLMVAVASGVLGGDLPWGMIGAGAMIGALIIAIDEWLRRRDSKFRMPVLAVAIGIYLPLELAVPIALGGVVAWLARRQSVAGVLAAAGLITGEALMGIFVAIPIVLTGDPTVLAADVRPFGMGAGLALIAVIAAGLLRIAHSDGKTA